MGNSLMEIGLKVWLIFITNGTNLDWVKKTQKKILMRATANSWTSRKIKYIHKLPKITQLRGRLQQQHISQFRIPLSKTTSTITFRCIFPMTMKQFKSKLQRFFFFFCICIFQLEVFWAGIPNTFNRGVSKTIPMFLPHPIGFARVLK